MDGDKRWRSTFVLLGGGGLSKLYTIYFLLFLSDTNFTFLKNLLIGSERCKYFFLTFCLFRRKPYKYGGLRIERG